ncbi:hypothetical protein GCM10010277_36400 [Streptomyces longisporoflavus]|uniref:hypothetical protein n=1 Tax=Streptomyces longisporoflavus TaxID=28044 RepID=UPI0019991D51|nr:hypothetical protein [Streptomyces longisporoflavus]GGV45479.1 hypothetical protein GCM10010277_36400 [Streptomyces longisporoflavus]
MAGLSLRPGTGRKLGGAAGALLALALVAGGYFWFGGGYDRWVAQRLVSGACEGVLPASEVRDVLGEGPYKDETQDRAEGGLGDGSLRVRCTIVRDAEHHTGRSTRDGSVTVNVRAVPERVAKDDNGREARERRREDITGDYEGAYPDVSTDLPPVALGPGWNGAFTAGESSVDGATATTAVLLDCARGRGGLLVTVDAKDETGTADDPRRRTAFARIATATAANASGHWGCDADTGKPPRTVAQPVNGDEDVAPADATGSCEGVPGRGSEVARAWEGARGGTPVEVCVLGPASVTEDGLPVARSSSDVGGLYRLSAFYGPFAQDERYGYQDRYDYMEQDRVPGGAPSGRLPDGGYWVSAVCEKGGERALFTMEPPGSRTPSYQQDKKDKPTPADRTYQRTALKAFAKASAKTHACGTPAPVRP